MTELSATAGSEGYAACDDDGGGIFYYSMLTSRVRRGSVKVRL